MEVNGKNDYSPTVISKWLSSVNTFPSKRISTHTHIHTQRRHEAPLYRRQCVPDLLEGQALSSDCVQIKDTHSGSTVSQLPPDLCIIEESHICAEHSHRTHGSGRVVDSNIAYCVTSGAHMSGFMDWGLAYSLFLPCFYLRDESISLFMNLLAKHNVFQLQFEGSKWSLILTLNFHSKTSLKISTAASIKKWKNKCVLIIRVIQMWTNALALFANNELNKNNFYWGHFFCLEMYVQYYNRVQQGPRSKREFTIHSHLWYLRKKICICKVLRHYMWPHTHI